MKNKTVHLSDRTDFAIGLMAKVQKTFPKKVMESAIEEAAEKFRGGRTDDELTAYSKEAEALHEVLTAEQRLEAVKKKLQTYKKQYGNEELY